MEAEVSRHMFVKGLRLGILENLAAMWKSFVSCQVHSFSTLMYIHYKKKTWKS